jgi:hypothetical protein
MEETRALEPGASEELRRRVLDGPPPQPAMGRLHPRRWLGSGRPRRGVLVGAPVVAGIIALAIAIPVLNGGDSPPPPTPSDPVAAGESAPASPARDRAGVPQSAGPAPTAAPAAAGAAGIGAKALPPAADASRAQQVAATTRVQVEDVATLSRASTSAMRTVRSLGGFTASSDYAVPNGGDGTNRLVFRVPVDRAEVALAAFGRLGTVTAQSASIVDLTARLDAAARGIDRVRTQIADLRARVAARPGDAALAAELARSEAVLRRVEEARAATLARTRLATLRLTLTTQGPPPPATSAGRFGGPVSRAGERLADAAAWTLGAIILVGPFLLLAAGAGWGALRLRGRSERRLMGSV